MHSVSYDGPMKQFRACLGEALDLPAMSGAELDALRERADSRQFSLVTVGEFKRGKSTLINALIGARLLPVGVIPLTAIATVLEHGEQASVEVIFENDEHREIMPQALADYVTEKGNPHNEKRVHEVRITWPSPWLAAGVRIIDTPGIGSVYRHNTDMAYRYLSKADAVLFILSADQPLGQAEMDFLADAQAYAGRIFFLLNKADLLCETELTESLDFARRTLEGVLGRAVPVYPVSARMALEAIQSGEQALLDKSRFPDFTSVLERFLVEGKDYALVSALAKRMLRIVSQSRAKTQLAIASLRISAEELQSKLAAFEGKLGEMEREKRAFTILLEAEAKRLADQELTDDADAFKGRLIGELEDKVKARFEANRRLHSRELRVDLEQYVRQEVLMAWDGFRREEEERVAGLFQDLCSRFGGKIDGMVDELFRFSSELFSVEFEVVGAQADWSEKSRFYYKYWNEPPALKIITSSLVLALPKILGDNLIFKQALRYARELAETQAGRVRYDFAQRLDKSMRDFKVAMLERVDTARTGIEGAIRKGMERNEENAAQADAHSRELAAELERLTQLADELRPMVVLESGV